MRARARRRSGTWISVNLSARQFAQPDLLDVVAEALRAAGLAPSSLCLELTEKALLGVTPAIVTNLEKLNALGVRLVLDDFGTGYSSFQHLKDFPIDMVKIDRSLVANLGRGEQDTAIIASVVSMASALGLSVIAEGVESEAQAELLRELGARSRRGTTSARRRDARRAEAAQLPVVPSAADAALHRAHHPQHGADHEQHEPEHVQDVDRQKITPGGLDLLREWQSAMQSVIPRQLLGPLKRQTELIQDVLERERKVQREVLGTSSHRSTPCSTCSSRARGRSASRPRRSSRPPRRSSRPRCS